MSELAEDPHEAASKLGLAVVLPEPNQLFIDIDDDESEQWMHQMCEVLASNAIAYEIEQVLPSKSGGKHVYIRFPKAEPYKPLNNTDEPIVYKATMDDLRVEFDDIGRVALQACLGSDRKRELLSMLRILLKIAERPPTVFFEQPAVADATVALTADDVPF